MKEIGQIIEAALGRGQKALSEYESKLVLAGYGIPVVQEALVKDLGSAKKAALQIGYPVVLKVCSPEITHKTESGLIEVDLRREADLIEAFQRLEERLAGREVNLLIQEMVAGARELVMGMTRDPQFGPCVMFGLGGIFTEILGDVSFRVATITRPDALEMMAEIKGRKILETVRGLERVEVETLGRGLIALGDIGLEYPSIREIDVNPLIVRGSQPVAVDALVVLGEAQSE
ncbi:MAG: acetate--CoA ligase family protein [Deltaproteobacteria bacterium]|nr:acetate--CoA ligase family protein [Deltaproteobacteria bacterium]